MNKTTFIEEIKKCFTLLQENKVIKKAIENLYEQNHLTEEQIQVLNLLEKIVVSEDNFNLGNDYTIHTTEEDGLYIYKGDDLILHINREFIAEEGFYYNTMKLFEGNGNQVEIYSSSEENYCELSYTDLDGDRISLNLGKDNSSINTSFYFNGDLNCNAELNCYGDVHIKGEVFFEGHPIWISYDGVDAQQNQGPELSINLDNGAYGTITRQENMLASICGKLCVQDPDAQGHSLLIFNKHYVNIDDGVSGYNNIRIDRGGHLVYVSVHIGNDNTYRVSTTQII